MANIEDVTVGELHPHAEPVVIVDYDPVWPETFARQRKPIVTALGGTLRMIEHSGSTAVPGLPAKPVIDITVAVRDSAAEGEYVPHLGALGYRLRIREPGWHEHRMLRLRIEEGDPVSVNLHVYTEGCQEIARVLAFRDWLREHPEDRDRYAAVKRELATRRWRYVQDYADAKTDVVESILATARAGGVVVPAA